MLNIAETTGACSSFPCGPGGICNNAGGGLYVCTCKEGYVKANAGVPFEETCTGEGFVLNKLKILYPFQTKPFFVKI